MVVQEFILTLKEADSLSPVYPLTADICTWYDPKELSIGVPLILIAIWALPFKSLGWLSIVKFIPLGKLLTSRFVIAFWFVNEVIEEGS